MRKSAVIINTSAVPAVTGFRTFAVAFRTSTIAFKTSAVTVRTSAVTLRFFLEGSGKDKLII